MKKLISMLLVIVMISLMGTTTFAMDFEDVTTEHEQYTAVEILETLGIVNGYGDNKYGPDDVLTRAQLATMLTRAMCPVYYNSTNVFTDVPVNHWARPYIDTAYRNGLMVGYGNNIFGPEDELSYTQTVRTILNALGYGELEWPTGVNTVAYALGLYENIDVIDFEAGCTRAHAAQILYNAFDLQLVRQYAGQHFVTNKTFLNDVLGYKLTSEYVDGHIYTAYEQISTGKVFVTDLCETYEATIYPTTDGEGYRLTKRGQVIDINWYWAVDGKRPAVYLYVNDVEISNGSEAWFAAAGSAIGIFDANNDLVAIHMTSEGDSYAPVGNNHDTLFARDDISRETVREIRRDSMYNEYTSTITYFKESDTYTISNKIVIGFVTDILYKAIEIDDVVYELNTTPRDCTIGNYAILYFNYADKIVTYQPIDNPYCFNLETRQYHTIDCPKFINSIWPEDWVYSVEDVAAVTTNPNGYVIYFGCDHCRTVGKWVPIVVPTGIEPVIYVTADNWTHYHTSTCENVLKDGPNTTLIYITDVANCGKTPHDCCN